MSTKSPLKQLFQRDAPEGGTQKSRQPQASVAPAFGQLQLFALGFRLREIRESRRWSLKRLAEESGISVSAIQKIELGTANASLLTVLCLSEALGEPVDRLVRTSQLDTRTCKLVHVSIALRLTRDMDLTAGLAEPRLTGQVVVVRAGTTLVRAPKHDEGPTLAFVIAGKLNTVFADGSIQSLAIGDAMHLSVPELMRWTNPHKTDAQVLCVTDSRMMCDTDTSRAMK